MCDDFTKAWAKRLSTNPKDQEQLYFAIEKIFKQSKYFHFYNQHDREDFFSGFYEVKILKALHNNRAITDPKHDDKSRAFIIKMIKNYHCDCFRKKQKDLITPQNSIDLNDFEAPHSSAEKPFKALSTEEQQQLFEPAETPLPFEDMVQESITFLRSADDWVYTIILNQAEGNPHSALPKSIKSYHSKLAKLGLIHKGSHYSGATSYNDYHRATLIGEWIADVYGDEFIPITYDFLVIIFKTFPYAALLIKEESGETNNDKRELKS